MLQSWSIPGSGSSVLRALLATERPMPQEFEIFFFAFPIKFSGSMREADTAHKVLKARVRAERIEAGPHQDPGLNRSS